MSRVRMLVGTKKGAFVLTSDGVRKNWEAVCHKFAYEGTTGTHQWYDGTAHPREFKRVWHVEPSLTDPDTVFADPSNPQRMFIAILGHCVHRIAMHASRPNTLVMQKHWDVLRTDDGGDTWTPIVSTLPPVYSVEVQTLP